MRVRTEDNQTPTSPTAQPEAVQSDGEPTKRLDPRALASLLDPRAQAEHLSAGTLAGTKCGLLATASTAASGPGRHTWITGYAQTCATISRESSAQRPTSPQPVPASTASPAGLAWSEIPERSRQGLQLGKAQARRAVCQVAVARNPEYPVHRRAPRALPSDGQQRPSGLQRP